MSEFLSQPNLEGEAEKSLFEITAAYLEAEDAAFLDELDEFDAGLNHIYGRLLEMGEDPDEILLKFNVIEEKTDEI